jgi:hypothetical protein
MRVTILSLAIIAAGLLGATQTASAQQLAEPNAYNYPWCSISNQGGRVLDGGLGGGFGPQCYYRTRKDCEENNGPQLGACYPNLEYRPFPGGLPPIAVDTTARKVESFRWCAVPSAATAGARDCYYDSLEECKTTMTGIIGNCYPNPYYRPTAATAAPRPAAAAATPRRPVAASRPVAATDLKTISAARLPGAKSAAAPAAIPAAIAATPSAALLPSGSRN